MAIQICCQTRSPWQLQTLGHIALLPGNTFLYVALSILLTGRSQTLEVEFWRDLREIGECGTAENLRTSYVVTVAPRALFAVLK